jgi:copper chaperone CopZ
MQKTTFTVDGMMCVKCKAKVENAMGVLVGLSAYSVDLDAGTVSAEYDAAAATPESVADAIRAAGFTVTGSV